MSWCVNAGSFTFAASWEVVTKVRIGRGRLRDFSVDSIGDGEVVVRHDGWVLQYRRAKAEVTVFHWLATRAAGRRAMGMALLMVEECAAVANNDWALTAL